MERFFLSMLLHLLTTTSARPLTDLDHRNLVGPHSLDASTDCAMRNLSYAYALHLLPSRAPLLDVFDALRLSLDCNFTRPSALAPQPPAPFYAVAASRGGASGARTTLRTLPVQSAAFFVDAARGSDGNSGTEAAPFATPARALAATRAAGGGGQIVLRGGAPYDLPAPLLLTPQDSGLALSAYPGEAPVLSGGVHLAPLAWALVGPAPGPPPPPPSPSVTLWRADLAAQRGLRLPFGALFAPSGRRATRARFPNGNPETDQEPTGYTKAQSWAPPPPCNQSSLVQSNPLYDATTRGVCPADACSKGGPQGIGPPWAIFCCFFWGWNATAVNFSTGSFWGVQPGPPGGGTARMPGGMVAGPDLAPRLAAWRRPTDALVHAFHESYWGDWAWTVQSVNASSGAFAFEKGGWQEARGAGGGASMYVENVLEELDAAGEWYVDAGAAVLYVAVNGTAAPASAGWVAGQLNNLITIAGTPQAPVENVSIAGLTLEFSEPTFLEGFTVGSGGDWSFHDGGALRLSGTRNCSAVGSLFINLGGTGVMVSGWNRGARVEDSEFKWLGESAIVSAGLSGEQFDQTAPGVPFGEGMRVARNLGHELGLYVKQTGFYYQAMTANASIVENVFFNGPRAGININDGAFGGHDISRNVGFNMVRETSDHGVFNSWDRNTYKWRGGDSPSADTLPIRMDRNLFTCNYRAYFPIDNDDGSNGYIQTNNFLLWGGSKTLMGYNKLFLNNSFIFVDYTPAQYAEGVLGLGPPRTKLGNGYSVCATSIASYPFIAQGKEGFQEQWWNNTCIASSPDQFFNFYECNASSPLDGTIPYPMRGNQYFSTTGDYRLHCRSTIFNFSQANALGIDIGSSVSTLPSLEELVAMGHDRLQF